MTSVALLSHRFGNIGHSFMALGAEQIVREAFGDKTVIEHFEQHHPFSVYPPSHRLRWVDRLPHGRFGFVRRYLNRVAVRERLWADTLPLDFKLAIACGGPNIVPGGSRAPELGLMLHHMNGAFHYRNVPLVDAGVGACFPLQSARKELTKDDQAFYDTAFRFCSKVVVRDRVAESILKSLGHDPRVLPCMAYAAGRAFAKHATGLGRYVIVNFQRVGANEDWGQGVDPVRWRDTVRKVISDLLQRHEVRFLAHNQYEARLAQEINSDLVCHCPGNDEEYARAIGGAKVGFVSRVHAAIPLAGIGIPSVLAGVDTRTGAIQELGLPWVFSKTAEHGELVGIIENLISNARKEHERLIDLRERTIRDYANVFREASATRGSSRKNQ